MEAKSIKITVSDTGIIEALTLLYLQSRDLSDVSPEELVKLYRETYERIAGA